MRMWIYIVRRLLLLVPVIVGVMTITFVLVNSLPIQQQLIAHFGAPPLHQPWIYNNPIPCSYLTPGANGTCQNPIYLRDVHTLGLDQPVYIQWAHYIYNSLTFNWGTVSNFSYAGKFAINGLAAGQPVTEVLGWLLPYTIELALLSLIIILAVAIPLGNLSAVYRKRPIDQASRVMSFSGYALPSFLLAAILLMAFVLLLTALGGALISAPWCPTGEPAYLEFYGSWPSATNQCYGAAGAATNLYYPGWLEYGVVSHPTGFPTIDAAIHGNWWLSLDTLIRMALPALVIAFGSIALLLRFVRNSMLEVMNLDFVRTARAKGVPEKTVINRHAGRNSLNVTITVLGLTFAFFIGGFPVIEEIFHLNGVGLILAFAVNASSYPIDVALVFGSTLLFTYLVVIANIIVDVLYAYLDPRVRLG